MFKGSVAESSQTGNTDGIMERRQFGGSSGILEVMKEEAEDLDLWLSDLDQWLSNFGILGVLYTYHLSNYHNRN